MYTREIEQTVTEYAAGHLRVLGPPGSGKTTLLVRRFEALEARDPGATLVLTYSRQSQERLLDAITAARPAGIERPPVTTYTALAIQAFVRPPEILSGVEEWLLLDAVVKKNRRRFESEYRAVCATRRFQDAALECCHVLMQNGISASDAEAMGGCSARLSDILSLYSLFLDALGERVTYYNLAWRAVERLLSTHGRNPFSGRAHVLIEDFQDVDAGQYALLRAAASGGGAALTAFGDPTGARFGFRGTDERFLLERFPADFGGRTLHLPVSSATSPALRGLTDRLIEETAAGGAARYAAPAEEAPPRPAAVKLHTAGDEYEEIALVAARIRELLDAGACAPEEIAVAARNKIAYEPVVSMLFQQYGIPLETGRPRHTAFRSLIASLITLILDGGDEVALRALETSPDRAALEELLRARSEGAPAGGGEAAFRALLRGYAAGLAARRGSWFEQLDRDLLRPLIASLNPSERARACTLELRELREEWRRYLSFAQRTGFERDDATFARRSDIFVADARATQPVAGRVGLYSCNQLSNLFFPVVFLVGCSETLFPALPQEEAFFPSAELERALAAARPESAISIYRARPAGRQMKDEYALLLHTVTRAADLLTITAPMRFGDQNLPAPSFIFGESPACEPLDITADDLLPPLARLSRAALRNDRDLLGELAPAIELAPGWNAPPGEPAPFSLERFPVSSSSLGGFTYCERKFYYQRVVRVPDLDLLDVTLGSMLHALLETICGERRRADVLRTPPDVIDEYIAKLIDERGELIPEGLFKTLFAGQLRSLAEKFFELEAQREDAYSIEATEEMFGVSRGGWDFAGRIDRIDRVSGGGRVVIDYKTGAQERRTAKTLRERILRTELNDRERNWQVPLYLWAVIERDGRLPERYLHYLMQLGQTPVALALHLFEHQPALDAAQLPGGRNGPSYLLREDLERCIDDAVAVASDIFGTRTLFRKTDDLDRCVRCRFRQLCRRSGSGSE